MHRHVNRRHGPKQAVPYWKRAHTDWRFLFGLALSFIAITAFLVNGDLSWQPHLQTQSGNRQ